MPPTSSSRGQRNVRVPKLSQQTDKMTVYQSCLSAFNSKTSPRKARILLARVSYLLATGETFVAGEATELFFSVSKLFQHKDPALRQMVYLVIKELSKTADDVLMLTASIMKDIQESGYSFYKPNAIRALIRVIEPAMAQNMERLFKNCIADKHPSISAAALVSAYHLEPHARDVVKRWSNTAAEAITTQKVFTLGKVANPYTSGSAYMYQYHAVGLLHKFKHQDRMAMIKLIKGLIPKLRNSNALIMIIRYARSLIDHDPSLLQVLKDFLKHKSEMVSLEAAKTLLQLKIPESQALPAVNFLRNLLNAPRIITQFAAVKVLNDYAQVAPQSVATCNMELESLVSSSSRAISTYAITTLLKTGTASSVDSLMAHIEKFTSNISDDFKIEVIKAVRSLALKFPAKSSGILKFLATTLHDDGNLALKTHVVDSLFAMIDAIPDCKKVALDALCDYMEDCEFPNLTVRILHVLGNEGPASDTPSRYIRLICNRLVLDNAVIRAAGVSSLAKFATIEDAQLQKSIKTLLERSLSDVSDEVRDRASLALRISRLDASVSGVFENKHKKRYDLADLEKKLVFYVTSGPSAYSSPFSITSVALESSTPKQTEQVPASVSDSQNGRKKPINETQEPVQPNVHIDDIAERVPEFAAYGPVLKSTLPFALTELETEYVVSATKYIFKDHVVVDYIVENTFKGVVLENVSVECEVEVDGLEEEFGVPATRIEAEQEPGHVFISFTRDSASGEDALQVGKVYNTLKFIIKEVDEATGEEGKPYEDDYSLEPLEITASDYLVPAYVGSDFERLWDNLGNELGCESTQTYRLSDLTLPKAVQHLTAALSLFPVDGTETVENESSATHTLKLVGQTVHGDKVAVKAKLAWTKAQGALVKLSVRCTAAGLAETIASSVA